MGLFEVTSLVAMLAGYAVAGAAWDARAGQAFFLLPLLYAGAWFVAGGRGEERPAEPGGSSIPRNPGVPVAKLVRLLVRRPGNLGFGVAWLAVNAVVGAWTQQAPYLLKLPDRSPTQALVGGFTGAEIGCAFGVWGLAFLVGIAAWSWLGARVARRRALGASLVAMLGVAGALALANHGAGKWALLLAAAFVLVESGFTPAALAHLADITREHDASRGAALGLYSLLLGFGQLLGTALGGLFAARWQMDGLLALTAALSVVALVSAARMLPAATRAAGLGQLPVARRTK